MGSMLEHLANPQAHVVKKYMFDILQDRYPKHQEILERIASALVTSNDLQAFGKLISDVYEVAYLKSLDQQKDVFKKAGIKVNVTASPPKKESKPIFKK
jgi:hypothetical protein